MLFQLRICLAIAFILSSTSSIISSSQAIVKTDPCIDYYEHVCADHVRQQNESPCSQQSVYFTDRLMSDAFANRTALNSSSSLAVKWLLDLHDECQKQQNKSSNWLHGFTEMLTAEMPLLTGKWTLGGIFTEAFDGETELKWTDEHKLIDLYATFFSLTGEGPIIDIDIQSDVKNDSQSRLVFSPNEALFILTHHELHEFITDFERFNISLQTIQELAALQWKIYLAGKSSGRGIDYQSQEALTLGYLSSQTFVNWTAIVNAILVKSNSKPIYTDADLVYADVSFLIKIITILRKTSPRIVENYLTLQFWASRSALYTHNCRWDEELTNSAKMFAYITSRIYVDAFMRTKSRFEVEQIRHNVTAMATQIKQTLSRLLNSTLDSDRLSALNYSIAYSDWYMDDRQLDQWHGLANEDGHLIVAPQIVKGDFLASVRNWIHHWIPHKWSKQRHFTAGNLWNFPISIANAWYNRANNHIYLTLGQLNPSMFTLTSSAATKYSITGFTLAHEMAHTFATTFENYLIYSSMRKCLEKQYSAVVDERSGHKVFGIDNVAEHFADNLGLQAAYESYRNVTANENGQSFFYSFASRFCSIHSEPYLTLPERSHSTHKHRVNVPLANLEAFGKAFNCRLGTPMNPVNKCVITIH